MADGSEIRLRITLDTTAAAASLSTLSTTLNNSLKRGGFDKAGSSLTSVFSTAGRAADSFGSKLLSIASSAYIFDRVVRGVERIGGAIRNVVEGLVEADDKFRKFE